MIDEKDKERNLQFQFQAQKVQTRKSWNGIKTAEERREEGDSEN